MKSAAALLFTLLAISLILVPPPRAAIGAKGRPPAGPPQEWLRVEKWNAAFSISIDESRTIDPGGFQAHVSHRYSASGSAILSPLVAGSGVLAVWIGEADFTGSALDHVVIPVEGGSLVMDCEASGAIAGGPIQRSSGSLSIDLQAGTFTFTCFSPILEGACINVTPEGERTTTENLSIVPCPLVENQPLPEKVGPISGGGVHPVQLQWAALLGDYTVDATVRWTLEPALPEPKLSLLRPDAGFEPRVDAIIQAQVVPDEPNQTEVPIRFILEEITREPGIHLNSEDTGEEPDLDFSEAGNAADFLPPEAIGPNGFRLETKEPAAGATAGVRCRDHGAWAKLRAEYLFSGRWKPVKVRGSSKGYATIPLDENENYIWDAWEKKEKVRGNLPPTWDEEAQRLKKFANPDPGDGLSLYEEYRGLQAQGQWRRLSPQVKELAVDNRIGAAAAAGLGLFSKASGGKTGIRIIEVTRAELGDRRVINRNSRLAHNADQHGLILASAALPAGVLGETDPRDQRSLRPKDCREVRIDLAQVLALPAALSGKVLAETVAHELAHGVAVDHHGYDEAAGFDEAIGPGPSSPPVFDLKGKQVTVPAGAILEISLADVGVPGGPSSGDTRCILCYNSQYRYVRPRDASGRRYFEVPGGHVPTTIFCTSGAGTGINSARNRPVSYFGDAAPGLGNCFGQFRVRDR